jgi:hypothetical protein
VLLGLPLPGDGDAAHHANMLRMLGSLLHIRCVGAALLGAANCRWRASTWPGTARRSSGLAGYHIRAAVNQSLAPRLSCSQRHSEEIATHTDLDSRTADAIAAFFGRGGAEPEAQGLALPVPQMQHL